MSGCKGSTFFTMRSTPLTIIHTPTSGNTIATRALRCFSHHYRSSNKLTEGHFLRAHSAGLSLQEIEPVDITAAHRGSACNPIRREQEALYRESVCAYNAYALRGVEKYPANPHSTSSIRASNSVRSTMVIPSSPHVDLKSMHANPIDYVRRSMDYARRSRISTTTPWLLLWEKASLSRLGHSFSSARQSLMLRISIFACKLSVVCPYVKGAPDSSSIENTYL